jgi:serine phosphatase RsbU (regulator of sigma subunit)
MIDPIRFKKILVLLLKILIIVELVGALAEGLKGGGWGRFGTDLLIAGILYVMWERITGVVSKRREEARRRMEAAPQSIGLFDALVFSLLWTDRIYANIPKDRLRVIVISYTLIALGIVAAFVKIGTGLMPLVVSGALVLGAVNLVTWVISLEREEKETLQTELKLARDVQMSLMPTSDPSLEGFDIAGISLPAANVGGDLFDYARLGEGEKAFGISVFDVSGKGMKAAMAAVFTSGAYATETRHTTSPAAILTRLNRGVFEHSRRGHFVAFLLTAIDPERRTITFANAGQTRPLLKSNGALTWLEPTGVRFPLGMQQDSAYDERSVQLARGDTLIMLTDGFTEAMNERQEMFGNEMIEDVLRQPGVDALTARMIIDRLVTAVRKFAGATPQHDDMTIVVVKSL